MDGERGVYRIIQGVNPYAGMPQRAVDGRWRDATGRHAKAHPFLWERCNSHDVEPGSVVVALRSGDSGRLTFDRNAPAPEPS